jgi:signal transduction histidine kinase
MLLHEFLIENRAELLVRCASKSARRPSAMHIDADIAYGVPQFLEQLIKTLRAEHIGEPEGGIAVSGPAGGGNPVMSEIGETAARHGRELSRDGYTVDQVVHDYGDICQAITDLAFERKLPIEVHEFRTLNRCLDNGIADAVSEFSYQRNTAAANEELERLGFLAHELRNQLLTATLALGAIKKGQVGVDGPTGMVLERSLVALRSLIDNSLAEVRMSSGMPANHERVSVAGFIAGVKAMASVNAAARECELTVPDVDGTLGIDIDSGMLASGLGNLLQNAFKFTRPHTEVCVHAYAAADRVLIEVKDHCGGLPAGLGESLFQPFVQGGSNKSGLGLGLAIAKRSVLMNLGILRVRDRPGVGCVFTIDLPRKAWPAPAATVA